LIDLPWSLKFSAENVGGFNQNHLFEDQSIDPARIS